jgi:hypothetical protein
MSTAAKVAANKEKHPELYCPKKRCLWRTGDGTYCPRHKPQVQDAKIPATAESSHSPRFDAEASPQTYDLRGGSSPIE